MTTVKISLAELHDQLSQKASAYDFARHCSQLHHCPERSADFFFTSAMLPMLKCLYVSALRRVVKFMKGWVKSYSSSAEEVSIELAADDADNYFLQMLISQYAEAHLFGEMLRQDRPDLSEEFFKLCDEVRESLLCYMAYMAD